MKEWQRERESGRGNEKGGGGGENWQTPSCQFCLRERGGLVWHHSRVKLPSFTQRSGDRWQSSCDWFVIKKQLSVLTTCGEIISCASQAYDGIWDWNELKCEWLQTKLDDRLLNRCIRHEGKKRLMRRLRCFEDNDRHFWCPCYIIFVCWRCIWETLATDWGCTLSSQS